MLKKLTAAVFLIMAFCAGLYAQPKIVFQEASFDFGSVPPNSQEMHVFEFFNKGTSTLHIKDIKAGWGCTGTLLSKKEVPAGGSGEIEISLETGDFNKTIVKTVYVYTDDPDNQVVVLKISAKVTGGKEPGTDKPGDGDFLREFNNLYQIPER